MTSPSLSTVLRAPLAIAMAAIVAIPNHAAAQDAAGPIRIVACDQPVQSKKRGISANHLDAEDFKALQPGVSWWYNWGNHLGGSTPPPDGTMEFRPMAWGDRPDDYTGFEAYLAAGNKPKFALVNNEPNLKGQAYITPEQSAQMHRRVKAISDKYGVPLVGPQMSIGSSVADSVTALDPIEKKDVTYTYMIPYLNAFFSFIDKSEIEAIAIHPYGNIYELRGMTELTYNTYGRPVWVTEYANATVKTEEEQLDYLIKSTDFLERTEYVHGYAWFKERVPADFLKCGLFTDKPGELSKLGQAYVNLPVHDADVYYRLPGRLQAENYVRLDKADIWQTGDVDGFTHMASEGDAAWLDYNVQVDQGGTFPIELRVTGKAGTFEILQGEQTLASVALDKGATDWVTLNTNVELKPGPQTLRVRFQNAGQGVNWIGFGQTK